MESLSLPALCNPVESLVESVFVWKVRSQNLEVTDRQSRLGELEQGEAHRIVPPTQTFSLAWNSI